MKSGKAGYARKGVGLSHVRRDTIRIYKRSWGSVRIPGWIGCETRKRRTAFFEEPRTETNNNNLRSQPARINKMSNAGRQRYRINCE